MRRALVLGSLAAVGLAVLAARNAPPADSPGSTAAAALDSLSELGDTLTGASVNADANLAAFLDMIAACEGASYNTLFGGSTFNSYADHPRVAVTATLGGHSITSTAAGRYQILERTWDDFTAAVGPRDFSPASQDECAAWLIRRRGALADVKAGRFDDAVAKCAKEWASLPGSPYGQPVKTLDQARELYASAGGITA